MIKTLYVLVLGLVCGLLLYFVVPTFPKSIFKFMMRDTGDEPRIVIVGGGLAGMSAAIEASNHGALVTIIEKEKSLGGNSAKATSGINGAGTPAQLEQAIQDSVELFEKDTLASGDGLSDPSLVKILARHSADAIDFLQGFGINLTSVVQLGGHSIARTHRIPPTPEGKPVPVGWTIASTLKKHIENDLSGKVTVKTNCDMEKLLRDEEDNVIGVQCMGEHRKVKVYGVVILTGGGYANDHSDSSLLKQHTPELEELPTTNGPWATGDIIKRTGDVNLELVHMDKVQVHPTGFVEPKQPTFHTKFLAPEALRGCGAILLNPEGKRFVNELGRRDHVTESIFKNCNPYQNAQRNPIVATMLLNTEVINKFGAPAAGFYKFKGLVQDVGSLENVAKQLGVSVGNIKETLQKYKTSAAQGADEFGKKSFPLTFSEKDHFLIAYITPTLHYCMGGIKIDTNAKVLRNKGGALQPVPGLFAAGEQSGGLHGNNRLGGNSLLECVVFGRVAGKNAAHSLK